MQVKETHIVKNESGTLFVLYKTFNGRYLVTTHIVGQVKEINISEALKLIQ